MSATRDRGQVLRNVSPVLYSVLLGDGVLTPDVREQGVSD